jgi:hypothetical protein
MDVSTQTLIDTALNVAGFIAAGGLLLLLATYFKERSAKASSNPSGARPDPDPEEETVSATNTDDNYQFVSLTPDIMPQKPDRTTEAKPDPSSGRKRDRREVIRMAREMIAAKQSTKDIQSRLPVTNAELALLSADNVQGDGA